MFSILKPETQIVMQRSQHSDAALFLRAQFFIHEQPNVLAEGIRHLTRRKL